MSSIDLIKGDALEILRDLDDCCIDLIVTDPPYRCISGGSPHGVKSPSGILSKNDGKIFEHNNVKISDFMPLLYKVLKNDSHAYVMTNFLNLEEMFAEARNAGFRIHNLLVWEKNNVTPSRWYMKNAEFTLFLYKGRAKKINDVGSKMVHKFNNIRNKLHPTEKPVELMELYVKNSSKIGDFVLDPFMGSGSTGIACKNLNRNFIGIEKDEYYFNVAKRRLDEM